MKSEDMLFDIALVNLGSERADVDSDVEIEDIRFHEISGGYWAASQVMRLEVLVQSQTGAFVIVPKCDLLLYCEIDDAMAFGALGYMLAITAAAYRDGPVPISPWGHWWHNGHLEHITNQDEAGFVAVLLAELGEIYEGLVVTQAGDQTINPGPD